MGIFDGLKDLGKKAEKEIKKVVDKPIEDVKKTAKNAEKLVDETKEYITGKNIPQDKNIVGNFQKIEFQVFNKSVIIEGYFKADVVENFSIKDGTYTSLTFKDGNLVKVGLAPLPVYTPSENI